MDIPPTEDASSEFYEKAKTYWKNVRPTIDGVLGGFGNISHTDINGSEAYLKSLFAMEKCPGRTRALDCGAGIGRVTKHLLSKYFEKVDLIDQNEDFVEKAKDYVGNIPQLGNLYTAGLQDFKLTEKYDVIWCQWVLVHLTDTDLITFMKNCKDSLAPNGLIVLKENITSSGKDEVDEVDSSVTRSLKSLKAVLVKSGLQVVSSRNQEGFPKALYRVIMMALGPA